VTDPFLDRLQRWAVGCCVAMAALAFLVTRGDWRASVAVLGGGVLIGVSFFAIRGAIEEFTRFADGPRDPARRPRRGRALVKMAGRYALLVILAYVMIARLRLHPLGLVAGASSVVAAAALEAGRLLWKKT